jgi:hypothetical protein
MTDSTQSAPDTPTSAAADVQSGAPVQAPAAEPVTPEVPAVAPEAEATGQEPADAGEPFAWQDFSLPDGVELDGDMAVQFKSLLEDTGKSLQEKAQSLLEMQGQLYQKAAEAQQQAQADQAQKWAEAVKADKEIGGENYDKSVATAVKAIEQFGSPELRNLLSETGIGNHPELVKFCHRIGKALSEDGLVMGGAQNAREMSIVDAFK